MSRIFKVFVLGVVLCLSVSLRASENWWSEDLTVEDQVKKYQVAYELSDESRIHSNTASINLSPQLWDLCCLALCRTRDDFLQIRASEDDFMTLEDLKNRFVAMKKDEMILLNDVRSLFIDLAFLWDRTRSPCHKLSRKYLGDYSGEWQGRTAAWWKGAINLDRLSFLEVTHQMFIVPEKGDSVPQTYLKAFLKNPKKKILILPVGLDSSAYHARDSLFAREHLQAPFLFYRKNEEDLKTIKRVCAVLWDRKDPLSTACLYFMLNDFKIENDDLIFDPAEPVSKEEQFFAKWINRCRGFIQRLLYCQKASSKCFIAYIETLLDKKSTVLSSYFDQNSETFNLNISLQPETSHRAELNDDTSQNVNVCVYVKMMEKTPLLQKYRVDGWGHWRDPNVIYVSHGERLEMALEPGKEKAFLPRLEKIRNEQFWVPTAVSDFVNLRGNYTSVLGDLYPEENFSFKTPENTLIFFQALLDGFFVQAHKKLENLGPFEQGSSAL